MKQKALTGVISMCTFFTSLIWIDSASVHAAIFEPPNDSAPAPREAKGGASRGNVKFIPPPNQQTPSRASGAGSRGSLFTPKKRNRVPRSTLGEASRGNLFTPKPGNETPKSGVGGASRGDSVNPTSKSINPQSTGNSVAAILPILPQTLFGTTVSEHPNILVYLPESTAEEAIFSLKDSTTKTLHQVTIPVSGKAEVISVQVPTTLEIDQNYQWFLALKIDGRLSPRTPYVDGWIQRIRPNAELLQGIQQKDGLEQATALCKNGVWYDCIVSLAKLRAEQPNNKTLNQHWSELLASVQLKEIENIPVIALNN